MRSDIAKLIARHGLDDKNWLKAPTSQLFLSKIACNLNYTKSDEYRNLIDAFFNFFTPRYDDSLSLSGDRILITPDENLQIIKSMIEEDKNDPYYTASSKTIAGNINPTQMHENYLYGVALGIASQSESSFMTVVTNTTINYLIYKNSPSPRDHHGGWYPYRVPWITARILISLSQLELGKRPDCEHIKSKISEGLDSLIARLTKEGIWRSGVGTWVSKWESTALCLEAFLRNDKGKRYKLIIESIVDSITKQKDWFPSNPNFFNPQSSNETLAAVLLMSVIIQLKEFYELKNIITDELEFSYLTYNSNILSQLVDTEDVEIRQFCTIPQVLSYCSDIVKSSKYVD